MKNVDVGSTGSLPVPRGVVADKDAPASEEQHYKDWPNAKGFETLGDQKERSDLRITGYFPSHVAGTLYRTGPGGHTIPSPNSKGGQFSVQHWFDGFTVVHRFSLAASSPDSQICDRISYSSRSQVDGAIEHARKTGTLDGITFGQRDPCDSFYKKLKTIFTSTMPTTPEAANIGVVLRPTLASEKERTPNKDGRKLITVTTDAWVAKHFDAETLEPLGVTDQSVIHPDLKGPMSASHACHDPITGDVYNYNLAFGRNATYRIFRASASSAEVDILAEISAADIPPSYLHSLFLTENFVVLCIWTAHYQVHGAKMLWTRNMIDAIAPFDPNAKTVWLVIDRKSNRGLVKKFTSPAMFSFHTINAWEVPSASNSDVVDLECELFEFENLNVLHSLYYDQIVSNAPKLPHNSDYSALAGGLARYRLSDVSLIAKPTPAANAGTAEKILYMAAPASGDLPTIHPKYRCKKHRYVYAVTDRGLSSFVDAVVKTDTQTETSVIWEQDKCTPGEPIFVPRPDGESEDDGHILSVVFDGNRGTSFLLCLDARDLTEVGRADVDRVVQFGFHGIHLREKKTTSA